ncbi:hypothetical protein [Azospirillum sp. TSO22-1]|uniref:hypothetical protein n=1 Tax=Azospirillum sp. TSO22-1 TaxID=716789 RepID=UPI0011B38A70|nr:hypothetical protein [Azospirillum sp. TSO22-1]
MSEKTQHVAERFPDLAQAIKQYASDNRFFHGLCEDYGEAVEMLHHLERLGDSSASAQYAVCREIVLELEQEILAELQLWNEGGSSLEGPVKP